MSVENYPQLSNSKPRIYKYTFDHLQRGILTTTISGHPLRDILDIQEQGDVLSLWAVVDTSWMGYEHTLKLYCAYTGDPPPGADWFYVKTIQSKYDGLVYHLYLKHDW